MATGTRTDFYPPLEPYQAAMLPLDTIHTMYYEQSGNPRGVPVVFLHGGPGSGASASHRQFFDPAFTALSFSISAVRAAHCRSANCAITPPRI